MMLTCGYIGFGKSTTRYHLPYVLMRSDWRVKKIYSPGRKPDQESVPEYKNIEFTYQIDDLLKDNEIQLIVVCTPPETHFELAMKCIENNKNVLIEKPISATSEQVRELYLYAEKYNVKIFPYQNRRFDSCYLTLKKVLSSGTLGEVVEVESHFDYFRPHVPPVENIALNGALYSLGVHTIDQMVALFGRPETATYDVRNLRSKHQPDDSFSITLFYRDLRVIIKTSHLVLSEYPRFIIHGTKGSYIKYGIDQQESCLKAGVMPHQPHFGEDPRSGLLEWLDNDGNIQREYVLSERGDYGLLYDSVYETLKNGKAPYITEEEVLTTIGIIEQAAKQHIPLENE
ncbi:oxidoreductase [Erwinia persicina]|uniref:oxidoreductase n=1 Tax=Erwinia persicina TaxID=55211 RepID=UPI001654A8D7|nr:oxidoreductase [Erwinia persicina]MBC3947916.1 oxidoreductase [Erwinia persicina]